MKHKIIVSFNFGIIFSLVGLFVTVGMGCGSDNSSQSKSDETTRPKVDVTKYAEENSENYYDDPYDHRSWCPVDSNHRSLYDTCIIECDTFIRNDKKIRYTKYWLFQAPLIKYFYCNYYFHCYQWGDSTLCYIYAPRTETIIINTRDRLTILSYDKKQRIEAPEPDSSKEVLPFERMFDVIQYQKNIGLKTFPIAKYQGLGVDENKDVNPGSWRTNFKKKYTEKGVLITNTDGQRFNYFIDYPFRMKPGKGNTVIKRRAEKLPPFLFCDMVDYFFMFGLQRTFDTDSYFAPADFSAYDE